MNAFGFIYVAALLNIVSKGPAIVWLIRNKGRYNNHNPRSQYQDNPTIQRLYAAHNNTLEGFPLFAAGMIAGHIVQLDPGIIMACGWSFIVARVLYVYLYALDWHWQRSSVWFVGWLASLLPLILAGFAHIGS